jgi:isoquinoline 1-oxidoreductase beta subunit
LAASKVEILLLGGGTVTSAPGVPQQSNFHDYPVLRMNEVPKITTRVIVTDHKPGGIGEVGLPPVAPAVANAVFKLTGKRLRELPFDQSLLKA